MQSLILTSIFLLIFTIQQGSSIRCYRCNSHSDQGCELDQVPDHYLKECSEVLSQQKQKTGFNYCRKITQIIEFSVNSLPPDSRIIRTCAFENQTSLNYCYQRAGFGGRQIVCSCDEDGCNSAITTYKNSSILYAIITSTLTILFVTLFNRKV